MIDDEKQVDLIPVLVMSNDPTALKIRTIELIYDSIARGQLAYMDGKDTETGEIVPLLVGLNPVSDTKYEIYPIAKLLIGPDARANYLVPDGNGSYTEPAPDNSVDLDLRALDADSEESEGQAEGLDEAPTRTLN